MNRSSISTADVPGIVRKLYNLNVDVIQELNSYDDQNFYVKALNSRDEYVLKILNSLDSKNSDIIELQTQITLHLRNEGYPTSDIIPCKDGRYLKIVQLPASKTNDDEESIAEFTIRLYTFIPGQTLDQVKLTLELCYEVGWFAGKMDLALENFIIKDSVLLKRMTRKWNLSEIPQMRNKVHAVTNKDIRCVILEIFEQFGKKILSCQSQFSRGLIHSDFNECNIIVSKHRSVYWNHDLHFSSIPLINIHGFKNETSGTKDSEMYHICSIIDFGDMTFSLYIFEVAIAMTYVMLNQHGILPMSAAAQVLAGYLQNISLSQIELQHLKLCICARLAQSIVNGYFTFSEDPKNEYILLHASRAWPVLKALWETSDLEALQLMNNSKQCSKKFQEITFH